MKRRSQSYQGAAAADTVALPQAYDIRTHDSVQATRLVARKAVKSLLE